MQQDRRDQMELLKFDTLEETIGKWLRTVIRRLEREQEIARSDPRKRVNTMDCEPLIH